MTPIAAMFDWFTPLWIGGALGIIGFWLSYTQKGYRSVRLFVLTFILLVVGTISAGSCFYFASPTETQLANPQVSILFFLVLLVLKISMLTAVLGGLIQVWTVCRLGISALAATNQRNQMDA
ncbi:MAG: hypothetical protein Q7U82_04975 [Gammaproteobacteria bacterium]|nr:hypothetical protein [Gammaproteobacteria bacterium]